MKRRTKRILIGIAIAILVLACMAVGGKFAYGRWHRTYITINGQHLRRDITELDLHAQPLPDPDILGQLRQLQQLDVTDTGMTTEQYEYLQALLPQCSINWSVPFQGSYLSLDTTEVSFTTLSEADITQLMYLKQLRVADANGCHDYEALLTLKQQKPDTVVRHTVMLSGTEYPLNVSKLDIVDGEADEISRVLPHLTKLREVTFSGVLPDNEIIAKWKADFPATTFIWSFEVCGVAATSLDTELYLNEIPMESVAEVENALKYFYDLKWVEMCDCGIPSEEMDALWKRHPETRFVWTVYVGRAKLRTDVKVFMPWKFGYRTSQFHDGLTAELKYCVDIMCMDLGHMGVSDLSFLNYMPNMKYLIIAETYCKDFSFLANLKELVYLEMFITAIDDVEILTGLTKLEDLNLSYCYPHDYSPLAEMTWLKKLWLIGPSWRISWDQKRLLWNSLDNTQVQFEGKGSVYGDWRRSRNYYDMRDLLGMPYYSPDPE